MIRRRLQFAAIVLDLLMWPGPPNVARAAADPDALASHEWLEVSTRHFTVLSDANEGIALGAARRLEQLGEMFRILHPGLRAYPTLPVDVYVFRDEATMAGFSPSNLENISGFATEGPGRFLFVMNGQVEGSERGFVVAHEYTHLFLRANFREMPIWLNEGLAQYYQTFRMRGRKAEFGHAHEWAPLWLESHEWSDLDLLFAMNTRSNAYQRDNDLRTNTYAEGWALTHYLQAKPDRAAKFDSILVALRKGLTPRNAFRTQYPPDQWPGIVEATRKHLREGMLECRSVQLPEATEAQEPRVRRVGAAEAQMRLGDLIITDPDGYDFAGALYGAALKQDSTLARAQAGLGYLADQQGDSTAAESWYQRATSRAPRDLRVNLLTGMGLWDRYVKFDAKNEAEERELDAVVERSNTRFRLCLELEPGNPEALAGLASTYIASGASRELALDALSRAADLLPSRKSLQVMLAEMLKVTSPANAPPVPGTPQ